MQMPNQLANLRKLMRTNKIVEQSDEDFDKNCAYQAFEGSPIVIPANPSEKQTAPKAQRRQNSTGGGKSMDGATQKMKP
jgi:hypothetical protein